MSAAPADVAAATSLLGDLVRIDSRNPDLVHGAPGEARIAAFCVEWLRGRGVDAWIEEVRPGRCNAVARCGDGSAPVLTLCAHLDTVGVDGMDAPFEPRLEGGRMHGRGAYDMKGGVAAIMLALAALAGRQLRGTVLAALVADEEFASIGAADFVARHRSDACIVTEPSEGRLIVAHKGFVWAEIVTTGVAAHGSRWEDGVSAIAPMGAVITALHAFDRDVLRARTHPLLGPASLHPATISGGEGWSTYARQCTLRVERRTLPGETTAHVLAELGDVARSAGVTVEIREVLSRSPLECPRDADIAEAVRGAVEDVTGRAPAETGVAYWMDAAIFADAGAATVDYGPTGGGAHAAGEWVELESVTRCAHVLERATLRFLG